MTESTNSKNNNIGVFGGSFDPVHNGHLIIASYAVENFSLDTLFIVPTYIPPHKKSTFAPFNKRLRWLKTVFSDVDNIEIDAYEGINKSVSYTIKTVRHFSEKFKTKPFLIIGEDSYNDINNWYRYKDIFNSSKICVYPRRMNNNKNKLKTKEESVVFFEAPLIDISSSLIRQRILNNRSVFGMLPCKISKEIVEFYEKNL
ncbi:MAG: nicotinate (nicotinamide) nucleotide adenylyltransferase [Kosmotogaceae bacterium]